MSHHEHFSVDCPACSNTRQTMQTIGPFSRMRPCEDCTYQVDDTDPDDRADYLRDMAIDDRMMGVER